MAYNAVGIRRSKGDVAFLSVADFCDGAIPAVRDECISSLARALALRYQVLNPDDGRDPRRENANPLWHAIGVLAYSPPTLKLVVQLEKEIKHA